MPVRSDAVFFYATTFLVPGVSVISSSCGSTCFTLELVAGSVATASLGSNSDALTLKQLSAFRTAAWKKDCEVHHNASHSYKLSPVFCQLMSTYNISSLHHACSLPQVCTAVLRSLDSYPRNTTYKPALVPDAALRQGEQQPNALSNSSRISCESRSYSRSVWL